MAYVDAEKLKENFAKRVNKHYGIMLKIDDVAVDLNLAIADTPTADVEEVRHGEWKRINHGTICTNCYRVFDNDFEFSNKDIRTYFKRCPECGAKMDVRYAE